MKVWEKLNQLKGTNANIETIASWMYLNRIYPYDIVHNNALELNKVLPEEVKNILLKYDGQVVMNGIEAVEKMLNEEILLQK